MKVLKFGGGCLKDSKSIQKLPKILSEFSNEKILIVVSAFGKMTNMLETHNYEAVFSFINQIMKELHFKSSDIALVLAKQKTYLKSSDKISYAYRVSLGEYLSSFILKIYLKNYHNIYVSELNAVKYVLTESWNSKVNSAIFRSIHVDDNLLQLLRLNNTVVTQGFIASEWNSQKITTLGREGSDYTAAIFGVALGADEIILFKDVDGFYTADPKIDSTAKLLPELSYDDAFALCSNGCTIIHPQTINHVKSHKIPILIKNFYNLHKQGTRIN